MAVEQASRKLAKNFIHLVRESVVVIFFIITTLPICSIIERVSQRCTFVSIFVLSYRSDPFLLSRRADDLFLQGKQADSAA